MKHYDMALAYLCPIPIIRWPHPSFGMKCSGSKTRTFSQRSVWAGLYPHSQKINFNLDRTNYTDLINFDENMLTINWADWDEFVRDAEGGPDPML
jgi:hypothetical protein